MLQEIISKLEYRNKIHNNNKHDEGGHRVIESNVNLFFFYINYNG